MISSLKTLTKKETQEQNPEDALKNINKSLQQNLDKITKIASENMKLLKDATVDSPSIKKSLKDYERLLGLLSQFKKLR